MITIHIGFYLIFISVIQESETLRCYSCRGDCIGNKTIDGNDLYDSCSITLDSNGSISRDLIPADTCRSSSYQFCCNQDLCNSLPFPPLPAFTNRKCAIGNCHINDDECNNSIVYLSSAAESCIRKHNQSIDKSYKTGCSLMISSTNDSILQDIFCCNSPLCNQQLLLSGIGISCYTCDSRITGLETCSILNTSSSHVYRSESSSRTESCATIIGLAGKDQITGMNYPAFTIRTFIDNCVNQSLGSITYGGASFQGRIDCCTTSFCNKHVLYTNLTLPTTNRGFHFGKKIIFILVICLGLIFVLIGISLSIYRYYSKKSTKHYMPCVSTDGTTVLIQS